MIRATLFGSAPPVALLTLAVGLLGTASTLGAQSPVTASASSLPAPAPAPTGVCAPTVPGKAGVLVPSITDANVSSDVEASLRQAYREIYVTHAYPEAKKTLEALRARVPTDLPCVRALVLFGLGAQAEFAGSKDAQSFYQEALAAFQALHSFAGSARAHLRLGRLLDLQVQEELAHAQYASAAEDFAQAGDIRGEIISKMEVASGNPDRFPPIYAEAEKANLPCIEAEVQQFWADALFAKVNYREAMEHDELALTFFAACPDGQDSIATVQTSMGRLERLQGRPEVALQHYAIALRLQQASDDHELIPQTYNAMAIAYEKLGDFPHVIEMYNKGLAVARENHSQPFIDFLEANLGGAYREMKRYDQAIPLLEKATAKLTSDSLRCIRFAQLGLAYFSSGNPEKSLAPLTVSIAACRKRDNADQLEASLEDISRAELQLHRYEDSLRDAREGLALLDARRAKIIPKDAYKQGFLAANKMLYDDAIADLTALGRSAEALETAEQARSRAFLDLMASHASPAPADVDHNRPKSDLIASPEQVAALSLAQMLQATARLHSTLLAYWCGDETLYIWVVTPDGKVTGATRAVSESHLADLVAATHQAPKLSGSSLAPWRALYKLLIAPVEAALPADKASLLTIVPSEALFSLAFPALLDSHGRYLVERFQTHTIPTVGLLAYTERNAAAANSLTARFLFVASPQTMPATFDGKALPPIPGTRLEVNAIARLLPAGQVTRFEGAEATAANFRKSAASATTIHMATHGVLNDSDPYASFLALDDAHHNGRLSVADLYALRLHSRLVVLSACRSGLGKITGDGVAGMSRAFFYAGAASVLATLWDIADQPTANLLPRFYTALESGEPPSAALRTAQLSTLRDLKRGKIRVSTLSGSAPLPADPAYWALFSLSGEP